MSEAEWSLHPQLANDTAPSAIVTIPSPETWKTRSLRSPHQRVDEYMISSISRSAESVNFLPLLWR